MRKVSFREFDFRVAIKCIERYFLGLVHSNGTKQSRAIVLNRFGLALIGRIAPDRSDADYVRRTRSTKRLRTIVLLWAASLFNRDGNSFSEIRKSVPVTQFAQANEHASASLRSSGQDPTLRHQATAASPSGYGNSLGV